MKKLSLSLTLLLLFVNANQTTNPLTPALDKFNREYPQEKVYLHFNKPYYYTNEDMWFKAYLVAGPDHLPSQYSDLLYTELIDEEGLVLKRNKLLLKNGMGPGDFMLEGLVSGNYTIRAYTHWMRNFDPDFFFEKQIAVISPIDGNPPTKGVAEKLSLDFYPEGGNLIAGVENRVGIEAVIDGEIIPERTIHIENEDGATIASCTTNEDGLASFVFTPDSGQQYFGYINDTDAKFALPPANTQGYLVRLNDTSADKVSISIAANSSREHRLYAIVQTRGMITYASQVDFTGTKASLMVPKKDLMAGISHFTLFNENWQPEAERLFFQMGENALQIQVKTDKAIYKSRDATKVSIKVSDKNGKPVQGSFSLAAVDANQINASLDEENIVSHLLLTSDLKGYIQNPARFFKEGKLQHAEELDLIMMTHGWRRFTWRDLLDDKFPEINYGVEQGIAVQGNLLDKNGDPVEGGTISHIGTFNEVPSMGSTVSLDSGFFVLGNLYFYENEENYLRGQFVSHRRKKKMAEGFVQVDTTARVFPEVSLKPIPLKGLSAEVIEDHIEKSIERQKALVKYEFAEKARDLGTVVVEGTRAEDTEKYGQQYSRIDFDDYVDFTKNGANALQLVNFRLPNVQMRGHGASLQPILTYNTTIRAPNLNPLILLDGQEISFAQLRTLPAARIKMAEVYRGTKQLQLAGREISEVMRGGVLEFTSRTDEEMLEYYQKLGSRNAKRLPGGLYETRVFYAPKYESKERMNPLADKRMVIFWEPMIATDEYGEAELLFFNADLSTTIQLDIQGISWQGIPGMSKASYEVVNTTDASK